MTKLASSHLRLFADSESASTAAPPAPLDRIERLCRAYSSAVGRPLRYRQGREPQRDDAAAWWAPVSPADDLAPRHLQLGLAPQAQAEANVSTDAAAELAAALADIVAELNRTQRALREREAELAAGVPVSAHPQAQRHLVERLEAVLRAAAEAVGCRAAAIYLLDAATTELKLRAQWGLPEDRLLEPARVLRGAQADLEALAGHAVALEDAALFPHWNLPEPTFPSGVCVPIASPTELLGTLWVFAEEKRPFSDHEVNLIELSAGRVASDLEREMLLTETKDVADWKRRWDDVVHRRRTREPQVAPLIDDWEIAGWLNTPEEAPGEFYDWLVLADGMPALALGRVEDSHFAAALSVESLRSAWRAHVHHEEDFGKLLGRVNEDLWSTATETVPAHLIGVRLQPNGTLDWSAAGSSCGLWLPGAEASAWPPLSAPASLRGVATPLGMDSETRFTTQSSLLRAGDRLLLTNSPATARRVEQLFHEGLLPRVERGCSRKWLEALVGQLHRDGNTPTPGALVVVRRKH